MRAASLETTGSYHHSSQPGPGSFALQLERRCPLLEGFMEVRNEEVSLMPRPSRKVFCDGNSGGYMK